MLPRVYAPAQPLEVEVPPVAEELPELREHAVGYVAQPKDSDVLTSTLRAASMHTVLAAVCRFGPCA
jgi:hypothetical protein